MNDDAALLHRYAEEGSQGAFTDLVRRHVDLEIADLNRPNVELTGKPRTTATIPNEDAILPYFSTPQEGTDYVEFMSARKAAGR